MNEIINEKIKVAAIFEEGQIKPQAFIWRNQKYRINKINLIHKERKGEITIHHFAVSCADQYFLISFSDKDLTWTLRETGY